MNAREKECLASKYHFVCTPKLFIAVKKTRDSCFLFCIFFKILFLKAFKIILNFNLLPLPLLLPTCHAIIAVDTCMGC